MAKNKNSTLPLTITLVIIIIASIYYYLHYNGYLSLIFQSPKSPKNTQLSSDQNEIPLPTRSPYPLIPDSGTAGTYRVSQGNHQGPAFTNITIDPLDATLDQDVKVTIILSSEQEIRSLFARVDTDTKPLQFQLARISRTDNQETWTGTVKLTSPILYTYLYHFTAKDSQDQSELSMALRN